MFDGTPIEAAMVATSLALILAAISMIYASAGVVLGRPSFQAVARRAIYWNVPLVALAFAVLVALFIAKDYSVLYVAQNSNSRLPLIYRATATWGAHEGSLMLWLLYLTVFSAVAARLHRNTHPLSSPYIVITLAAIQAALIAFILFLSNPFTEVTPPLPEGRDLNPLLQDPGLIFHPPLLYMGYVGFSVPFAFAIAALVRGEAGSEWVTATRRWTLFSWVALTSGIMLGGYWSYYELGWGGYWAWDPVENASFMPWLTATAFLHSVMAQERRDLFRVWNLFLILSTFCLSLMGTFLVRSGILTSVHAFAVDPDRGVFILVFLALTMFVSFGLLAWRGAVFPPLRSTGIHMVSRESALLYNNLLFMVALATVFLGTLLPLFREFLFGDRISVAAPYFNKVMAPLMLGVVLLMGIGPVIPWRRASGILLRRKFLLPFAVSLAAVLVLVSVGMRSWLALACSGIVAFAASSILSDIYRESRVRAGIAGIGKIAGFAGLVRDNRRRYGGLLVHFGILVIALGLLGSGLFKETRTVLLSPGDTFALSDYQVTYHGLEEHEGPNYLARRVGFSVARDGEPWKDMYAEKRRYPRGEMTTTEAGIESGLLEDFYLSFEGEQADGRISVRAYRNPLVNWIWIGWLVVLLGAGVALTARRRTRPGRRDSGDPEKAPA